MRKSLFWFDVLAFVLLLLFFTSYFSTANAQTVTLTASPSSGDATVTPMLTWTVTGTFASCTATGGWSGSKAVIGGSETVAAIVKDTTYNLTCTTPAGTTGSATLTWTAPTTRTDGSPYTNAAGYRIYYGPTAATMNSTFDITSPGVLTKTLTGIAVGTTFFSMTAIDLDGIESKQTNALSKAIVGTAGTSVSAAPVTVKVKVLPGVPQNFTVVAVIANTNLAPVFRFDARNQRDALVGLMEAGALCSGPVLFRYRGASYRAVRSEDVGVWFGRRTRRVASACA